MYFRYKNHTVQAAPEQLADNLKWTVSAEIWTYFYNGISSRTYTCSRLMCDARDEALALSIDYGRHLIDGMVPGVPRMY